MARVVRLTAVAALLGSSLAAGQQPARRLVLGPCSLPGVEASSGAKCGVLSVRENRAVAGGRMIQLRVVVFPATGRERAPDPVFYIAGGPGSSIVEEAGDFASDPPLIREHRDVVLLDQRGTGGSHPINCLFYGPPDSLQSFLGDFMPPAAVRRCRDQYAKDTDVTQYTTTVAAADMDEVRAALGYERINLSGGSYGTRAAQEYLRRYPARVRVATLFGVVVPSEAMPQHFARDAQTSLDAVIKECAADASCRAAFPDVAADVRRVFETLRRAPARATVEHPRTKKPATVSLSYDMVAETLRYMLYSSMETPLIPVVMHKAAQGDFGWIARRALRARGANTGNGNFDGLYVAITCAEDLPRTDAAREAVEAKGTFLGEYRMKQQRAACAIWGTSPVPADFSTPVRSTAAVLLVTGANDPVTPPRYAAEVARTLPNSLNIVVPFGAHGLGGLEGMSCIDNLERQVIEQGSVVRLDTSCVARMRRKGFPIEIPVTR